MRIANIATDKGPRLCVKGKNGYTDIAEALNATERVDIKSLFTNAKLLAAAGELGTEEGTVYPERSFLAIVTEPTKILCLGLNYKAHAKQMGKKAALFWPEIFLRHQKTIVGPHEDLIKPYLSRQFQFEGELGIVIGKGGRFIKENEAADAIAGFVAINDATAREWQLATSQWTCGKNFDATFPVSSEMLTADETDPMNLSIRTTVNGNTVQDSNTSEMILNVRRAVEFLSGICRLNPGDIIATGTPAILPGPSEDLLYLKDGDSVGVVIQDVGEITHKVREEAPAPGGWPWIP